MSMGPQLKFYMGYTKNAFDSVWANIAWQEVLTLGELTFQYYSNTVHFIVYLWGGIGEYFDSVYIFVNNLKESLFHYSWTKSFLSYRSSLVNKFNTRVFSTRYFFTPSP